MNSAGLGQAARFLALGFEFAAAVLAGVFVGYTVDSWIGSSPAFLVVFTVGAMAGAVVRLLWMLRRLQQRQQ